MRYATRADAIRHEVVEPLQENAAEYDLKAIADEVLGGPEEGYACKVGPEEFLEVADRHRLPVWARDANAAWKGDGYYAIGFSDGGMDWTNNGPVWLESVDELSAELEAACGVATDTHLPSAWVCPEYVVKRTEILCRQVGESYVHELASVGSGSETLYDGPNLVTARAHFESAAGTLGEGTAVYRAKRGLDSLTYLELELEAWHGNESDPETLGYATGLTPELNDLVNRAMANYWEFLDYHEDYYVGLADLIEQERARGCNLAREG